MSYKPTRTFSECARWGLRIVVKCLGCERRVLFNAKDLQAHFWRRGLPTHLQWAGRYFTCQECGHRGAKLYPDIDLEPPPPPPPKRPTPIAEYAPRGIDPDAWARADDRARKRLIRKARG